MAPTGELQNGSGELNESGLQTLFGRLARRVGVEDPAALFDDATFLSLGSEEGHAVITTAAWFPQTPDHKGLRLAVGLERSGSKHRQAQMALNDTEKVFEDFNVKPRVAFVHGDVDLDFPKLLRPPCVKPAEEAQTILVWVNDQHWSGEMRNRLYKRLNDLCSKKADVWILCCKGPSENSVGFFTRRCVSWTEEGILTGVGAATDVYCFRFTPMEPEFDWTRRDQEHQSDAKTQAEELDGALGRRIRCGEPLVHLPTKDDAYSAVSAKTTANAAGTTHLAGPEWNKAEHALGDINGTVG